MASSEGSETTSQRAPRITGDPSGEPLDGWLLVSDHRITEVIW